MDERRITTTRYESGSGRMDLVSGEPHPALRERVRAYWGVEERSPHRVVRLEVPQPDVIYARTRSRSAGCGSPEMRSIRPDPDS